MSIKHYLKQTHNIDKEIETLLESAERLRSQAERTTSSIGGVGGDHDPHSRELIMAKLVDTEAQINERVDALVDAKREILSNIEKIEDSNSRLFLTLFYIEGRPYWDICEKMHYSYRHLTNIHNKAIKDYKQVSE